MRLTTTLAILLIASPLALAAPKAKQRPTEDGSAPRAALLMYDKMVGPNEADKALPLYYARTTRERALAAALAKCDGAIANLRAKATAKYGPETADAMIQILEAATTSDINAAKIDVTGDSAQVTFPRSPVVTTMVRVNGEWKISVKSLFDEMTGPPKAFRLGLARVAAAANNVAAKIEEGQFNSPEDANKQLLSDYKQAFRNPAN